MKKPVVMQTIRLPWLRRWAPEVAGTCLSFGSDALFLLLKDCIMTRDEWDTLSMRYMVTAWALHLRQHFSVRPRQVQRATVREDIMYIDHENLENQLIEACMARY